MDKPIIVSEDEAIELYRFTKNDYINPNNYPALLRLLTRISKSVDAKVAA